MPRCRYCGDNNAQFRLVRRNVNGQSVRYSQCQTCNAQWKTNTQYTYGRRSNR